MKSRRNNVIVKKCRHWAFTFFRILLRFFKMIELSSVLILKIGEPKKKLPPVNILKKKVKKSHNFFKNKNTQQLPCPLTVKPGACRRSTALIMTNMTLMTLCNMSEMPDGDELSCKHVIKHKSGKTGNQLRENL